MTNQCECAAGDTYLDDECITPDEVQEVQAMNATVAAQVEQESTATAPQTAPAAVAPTPVQNQNMPVSSHKTSAVAKLVAEAQVQATTSIPAASTTPPRPTSQAPATIHASFLHEIYSFFANLLGF